MKKAVLLFWTFMFLNTCEAHDKRENELLLKGIHYSDYVYPKVQKKWTKRYILAAIGEKKCINALEKAVFYFKKLEKEFPQNKYNFKVQSRLLWINPLLGREQDNREIMERLLEKKENASLVDDVKRIKVASELANFLGKAQKNQLNANKIKLHWRFIKPPPCGCVVFLNDYKTEEIAFILSERGHIDLAIKLINEALNSPKTKTNLPPLNDDALKPFTLLTEEKLPTLLFAYSKIMKIKYSNRDFKKELEVAIDQLKVYKNNGLDAEMTFLDRKWRFEGLRETIRRLQLSGYKEQIDIPETPTDDELKDIFKKCYKGSYLYLSFVE